jgi:hypothetical protein
MGQGSGKWGVFSGFFGFWERERERERRKAGDK